MISRQDIELGFERWGRAVQRLRWVLIVGLGLLSLVLGAQVPNLRFETSIDSFLHPSDPALLRYEALREQFGRDDHILLAIEPVEIFEIGFLRALEALHEDLEENVPQLQEVTSLVNVRSTRGEGDELIVKDLLEDFPETESDLAALRERVMGSPSYVGSLISADGRVTLVTVQTDAYSALGVSDEALEGFDEAQSDEAVERVFITGEETRAIVAAITEIVERHRQRGLSIQFAGSPVLVTVVQRNMGRDLGRFMGLALLLIAVLLGLMTRRLMGVILPLGVVVLSLFTTLGLMTLLDIPFMAPTQILPSFLLAVGISYTLHFMIAFTTPFDAGESAQDAVVHALGHSGLPILMTGLTTIVGLLSFVAAEVRPIALFGVVAPLGVMVAVAYGLLLLPALLLVVPLERRVRATPGRQQRFLMASGVFASRHPWSVVAVAVVLMLVSCLGIARIQFSHNALDWFPVDDPMMLATEYLAEHLGGSTSIEVVIDTGRENGLYEPDVMNGIAALEARIQRYVDEGEAELGKTSSILQILRETHQALNENRSDYYAIPQDRDLIAQELLLFENSGSDDLEDVVDSQLSLSRFTIRTARRDAVETLEFMEGLQPELQRIMGDRAEVWVTGQAHLMTTTMSGVMRTMARSYAIALVLITPLMMLLIGSLRSGLVSMVPNLTPILMTLGMMGFAGITLNTFTLLIGCIAMGLAVDDTIHFIHSFQRLLLRTGDAERAVRESLAVVGRALLISSLVLTAGFMVFALSSMPNLAYFGLVTSFAIASAFIADITITPALLILVTRRRLKSRAAGPSAATFP